MKFTIHIPEKVSLNKIYAGVHFRERMRHKQAYFYAVQEAKVEPWRGLYPVDAHYHFKVKGTALDISNNAYMLKMCEDALVAAGVLLGDDPKYVRSIRITAEKAGKYDFDKVEVTLSSYQQ